MLSDDELKQRRATSAWEFACGWYKPDEIARSIARISGGFDSTHTMIPTDVNSKEFADWLTEQYRLAMTKGIEIGRRNCYDDLRNES